MHALVVHSRHFVRTDALIGVFPYTHIATYVGPIWLAHFFCSLLVCLVLRWDEQGHGSWTKQKQNQSPWDKSYQRVIAWSRHLAGLKLVCQIRLFCSCSGHQFLSKSAIFEQFWGTKIEWTPLLESGGPDFWKIRSTLFWALVFQIRAILKNQGGPQKQLKVN